MFGTGSAELPDRLASCFQGEAQAGNQAMEPFYQLRRLGSKVAAYRASWRFL